MDFDNTRPIYLQLLDVFRSLISTGEWEMGEKIPSVRNLAEAFGVNPNTVQRALAELERDGLTITERTTGRFVTTDEAKIQSLTKNSFNASCDQFIDAAEELKIEKKKALNLLEKRWNEKEEKND